jgi:hypothetical protein
MAWGMPGRVNIFCACPDAWNSGISCSQRATKAKIEFRIQNHNVWGVGNGRRWTKITLWAISVFKECRRIVVFFPIRKESRGLHFPWSIAHNNKLMAILINICHLNFVNTMESKIYIFRYNKIFYFSKCIDRSTVKADLLRMILSVSLIGWAPCVLICYTTYLTTYRYGIVFNLSLSVLVLAF